jgi:hypothetical protein
MSHQTSTAFVGTYDSVEAASADFDAVARLREGGQVGHVEAAVVSRDDAGRLTWDRHERLGGIHLSHAPTDDLVRLSDQIEAKAVALVVLGSAEDCAAVTRAATGAGASVTQAVQHPGLAEGYFAGGGGTMPEDSGGGYEDGSVGHLGV